MFERYTEKAQRVIFFARYEASQFSSPVIASEHLLLGILREDKGIADRIADSAAAVESIRLQIEHQKGVRQRVSTSVDLPVSMECKRVLAYSSEEAERLNHKHIGTGHLLFGVMREENCLGAQILRDHGVSVGQIRDWLVNSGSEPLPEAALNPPSAWAGPRGIDLERYSVKAAHAIQFARSEAIQLASFAIEAEHLLLGLLREDKAIANRLLHSETAAESIRERIESNKHQVKRTPLEQFVALRRGIASIALNIEATLANHELERLRSYMDQQQEQQEALRRLQEENHFDDSLGGELPLSEQCQRVLSQGAEDATLLKQRYIGTEHLLLGILREEKSFAADILHESGLQLGPAREEIARWSQEQGGDHV